MATPLEVGYSQLWAQLAYKLLSGTENGSLTFCTIEEVKTSFSTKPSKQEGNGIAFCTFHKYETSITEHPLS